MIRKISKVLETFNASYGQDITPDDVSVCNGKAYISTEKVAVLLGIDYHHFTVAYAKTVRTRVHMIQSGKNKYYSLSDLTDLISLANKHSTTVLKACKISRLKSSNRKS